MDASTSQAVKAPTVKLLIGGQFVESKTTQWRDVVNPATQQLLARVPFATPDEINAAVASAKEAFKTWKKTPIGTRARIFLKLQQLIRENMKELAADQQLDGGGLDGGGCIHGFCLLNKTGRQHCRLHAW